MLGEWSRDGKEAVLLGVPVVTVNFEKARARYASRVWTGRLR